MPKRKATTELNHLNWDQDDVEEIPSSKRSHPPVLTQNPPAPVTLRNVSTPDTAKTRRSEHFRSEIATLNRELVDWLRSSLEENPEVLLTRVFLDHQRHVQKLFDEERKLDLTEEQRRILDNQERVLHLLVETGKTVPVTSNGVTPSITTNTSSVFNNVKSSPKTNVVTSKVETTNASSKAEDKTETRPFFVNPFPSNNASPGNNGLSALNNGLIKDADKMVNPFLSNNSANRFTTSTFASAAAQMASKQSEPEVVEVDEDEPPKVEVTPVLEDGAVYTKRCKVFFKKDGNAGYEDRGVANLFLKPVADSSKYQLIVRADTNLGNLLLNVLLTADLPVKKLNATNAMLVCVPTPGSEVRTVLIRVKSAEDCEELVGNLNKYQKGG